MDEEQSQFDIYFQGSQDDLFAFLYPLTGPNHSIFQHFNLQQIDHEPSSKKFDFIYSPENFSNIDKQKQQITYTSTSIPSQSNYFYSTMIPEQKALVWRNINRFVELRPSKEKGPKQVKTQKNEENKMQNEEIQKKQLNFVEENDIENKVHKKIYQAPTQPLNKVWDISKEEYLTRLSK